ncbi:uncharacterized protein LOC144634714 isoform X2 [Oculina patagonica]
MKRLLLNLVVIFSIINAGSSISCYNCEGLESVCNKNALILHHDRYLRVCGGNTDRCMRVWQKTDDYEPYVQNICSNERLCDKLEKACKQLEKEGYECAVACCHGEVGERLATWQASMCSSVRTFSSSALLLV